MLYICLHCSEKKNIKNIQKLNNYLTCKSHGKVAHIMEKYSKYEMLHKTAVLYLENAPELIYYLKDNL